MQFLLHVGLPKTGTTYLQEKFFPRVGEGFVYLGKRIDGSKNFAMYECLRTAITVQNVDLYRLQAEFRNIADQKERTASGMQIYIWSDEMCSVDSNGITWQEKFGRLALMLDGYETLILATLRDRVDALYSLFVELYPTLHKKYRNPRSFIQNCNSALAYNFDLYFSTLEKNFGKERIRTLWHDQLERSESLSKFSSVFALESYSADRVNTKKRTDSGAYITNPITLRHLLSRKFSSSFLRRIVPHPLWSTLSEAAGRLNLRMGVEIPRFDKETIEVLADDQVHMRTRVDNRYNSILEGI